MTAYKRSLVTLEKAGNQLPLMNNIITDFSYNIVSLVREETSPLVLEHGKLLYSLEKNILIPTLTTLAARCQLDTDAEVAIIELIRTNNQLQDFFKSVTLGTISQGNTPLENAIIQHYRPEAITACTDKATLWVMVERATKAIEGFWTDIDEAIKNWKEAMALFGWSTNHPTKTYAELQSELLQAELSRQWLSQGAIAQMSANLTCMQQESVGIDGIEDWARARAKCVGNPLIWYAKLRETLQSLKWREPNSDKFISMTEKVAKRVEKDEWILILYSKLSALSQTQDDDESTTNTIITNLLQTHTHLVGLNTFLERRIPIMQANCMRWNSGITGGCYIR